MRDFSHKDWRCFDAHLVLRERVASRRRTPFVPIQCFGLPCPDIPEPPKSLSQAAPPAG